MEKMNKLKQTTTLLMWLGILLLGNLYAQNANGSFTTSVVTPGGMLDAIFDKDGNQYNLNDLRVHIPIQ
jgi:hypothetical protein